LHWVPALPACWQHVGLWNWQYVLDDAGRQDSPALQVLPALHGWLWLPVGTSRQQLPPELLQTVVDCPSHGARQARPLEHEPFGLHRSPAWPEGRQHLLDGLLGPQLPGLMPEKQVSPTSQVSPAAQGWPAAPGSRQHSWSPSAHCVGSCTQLRPAAEQVPWGPHAWPWPPHGAQHWEAGPPFPHRVEKAHTLLESVQVPSPLHPTAALQQWSSPPGQLGELTQKPELQVFPARQG